MSCCLLSTGGTWPLSRPIQNRLCLLISPLMQSQLAVNISLYRLQARLVHFFHKREDRAQDIFIFGVDLTSLLRSVLLLVIALFWRVLILTLFVLHFTEHRLRRHNIVFWKFSPRHLVSLFLRHALWVKFDQVGEHFYYILAVKGMFANWVIAKPQHFKVRQFGEILYFSQITDLILAKIKFF